MANDEELLDSDSRKKQKIKGASYYENRSIIYVVCMLGGGLIYSAFFTVPKFHILIDTLLYTVSALTTAIPIEFYRKYRRDKKNKIKLSVEKEDPLWFQVIESALSLLILILILSFLFF